MTAQIDEIEKAIAEMKSQNGERYSIKQMEKTRKGLEARLEKLRATDRKDDVITFEQLGVDRLFVDEAHAFIVATHVDRAHIHNVRPDRAMRKAV